MSEEVLIKKKEKRFEIEGIISDIQKYSIHDGPGIRTVVFLKGCPLRCVWCQNPEAQDISAVLAYYEAKCVFCFQCVSSCPRKAIEVRKEAGGKIKLFTNLEKCDKCGICEKICPQQARRIIGEKKSVGEILEEVKKDVVFYRRSGGGVTLSGGELTMQAEFSRAILKCCQEENIHTAIETSGYVEWNVLKEILKFTDLVLYDLKHMDPNKHQEFTGVSNELILQNLSRSIDDGKKVIIRFPLIPGFNDDMENIETMAKFIKKLDKIQEIDVLPYHRLGKSKYQALQREYSGDKIRLPTRRQVEEVISFLASYSFQVRMAGFLQS